MNFWGIVRNALTETEADVLKAIVAVKQGVDIAERDFNAACNWCAKNAPLITADIQSVVAIAGEIGITANPEFGAAVTAANVAVEALNAFAAARNAGSTNVTSLLSGYQAVKQAQAAAASATAALVAANGNTATAKAA